MMQWVVVKFVSSTDVEEIEVVPNSWLKKDDECLWPPFKKTSLEKSIKSCMEPNDATWEICKCKILSRVYDKFSLATAAASKAQYSSDLDEHSSNDILPGKRRIRKNPRFIQSNSDSENENTEDENFSSFDLPDFPDPDKRKSTFNKKSSQLSESFQLGKQSNKSTRNETGHEDTRTADATGALGVKARHVSSLPASTLNAKQSVHIPGRDVEIILPASPATETSEIEDSGSFEGNAIMKEMVKLLVKNNNLLKTLSQDVDSLNEKITNMVTKTSNINIPDDIKDKMKQIMNKLPATDMETLTELETELINPEIYKALMVKLSHIGGENYKEAIRRIMPKVISNEVAKFYSWVGHKGKKPFCKLYVAKLVVETVELVDTKQATLKNIEESIAKWLTKASERVRRANVDPLL